MEDSNSNISTSSSTIDVASNKSSEDPVNNSGKGLEQRFSSNIDSKPSSTSFSDTNVGGLPSNTSFQDSFSTGSSQEGASAFSGSQSMDTSLSGDQSSLDIGVFHTKRKLHGKDKKVCRVCGDKALGYNFNAMTCESCKAFFRRNALKQATPNCMFQGNCSVDIRTRRFCPHCRLKKCFSMGMKKEMILDFQQRRARQEKIAANRQKQKASGLLTDKTAKTSHMALNFEQHDHSSAHSIPKPGTSSERETETCKETTDKTKLAINNQATSKRTLNAAEEQTIKELGRVYLAAFVTTKQRNCLSGYQLEEILNVTKETVEKLIKFFKGLNDFSGLDQSSQVYILKAKMTQCLILQSAYDYQRDVHGWSLSHVEQPVDFKDVTKALGSHNEEPMDKVLGFSISLQEKFGKDPYLFAILHLITLFNPCIEGLKRRQVISDLQMKYITMLKHYLESKFTYCMSKSNFSHLLLMLNDMEKVAAFLYEGLSKMPLHDPVDPLMAEILPLQCNDQNLS